MYTRRDTKRMVIKISTPPLSRSKARWRSHIATTLHSAQHISLNAVHSSEGVLRDGSGINSPSISHSSDGGVVASAHLNRGGPPPTPNGRQLERGGSLCSR
jgi:hypothetical protein